VYLFYADESNLDPATTELFVYGGVAIPGDRAAQLSNTLDTARLRAGVPPEFPLKFNPGPAELSHDAFASLKQTYLEEASRVGCVLVVSLVSHRIARSPDEARRFEINRVLYHFDCVLHRRGEYGLVLVDRFDDRQIDTQLRERFAVGVHGLPFTDPYRLERILGYHYSCIGQSHFTSLVDIAIGSLRFAINAFTLNQGDRLPTARKLIRLLGPLFMRDHQPSISPISLHFSPDTIKVDAYRKRYREVIGFLRDAGLEVSQGFPDAKE
jgi:hypothetical protein